MYYFFCRKGSRQYVCSLPRVTSLEALANEKGEGSISGSSPSVGLQADPLPMPSVNSQEPWPSQQMEKHHLTDYYPSSSSRPLAPSCSIEGATSEYTGNSRWDSRSEISTFAHPLKRMVFGYSIRSAPFHSSEARDILAWLTSCNYPRG